MFNQHEFANDERVIFEDPEDMLERVYENLQESVLSYVFWVKMFCEGADSPKVRQELLDLVASDFDFFERYLMVRADDSKNGIIQLHASIRRQNIPTSKDRPKNPE